MIKRTLCFGSPAYLSLKNGQLVLKLPEVEKSGLLPTLGIHHHNKYNACCLADVIMEPYRPYIDRFVVELFDSGVEALDKDTKAQLLSLPVMDVMIGGQRSPLMIAVGQTASSLIKCFNFQSI